MELHAVDLILLMLNCHYLAVICTGGDLKAIGYILRGERMIARNCGLLWQAFEQGTIAIEGDCALLAVHKALCVDYLRAECLTYRLVAESHAQRGYLLCKCLRDLDGHACVLRSAGAR